MSKVSLRKQFRDIRSKIPNSYRQQASITAAKLLAGQNFFVQGQHVACYLAYKDEFDSLPVIEAIWQAKKHCYLPVLQKDQKTLMFVRYVYGDALRLNSFSILEPINVSRVIAPQELDLVITPLLAFDLQGHRLGTGGGYYDTTFAFMHESISKKPRMVGLAYAAQQAEILPNDPWDINLNDVVTEKEVFDCRVNESL